MKLELSPRELAALAAMGQESKRHAHAYGEVAAVEWPAPGMEDMPQAFKAMGLLDLANVMRDGQPVAVFYINQAVVELFGF